MALELDIALDEAEVRLLEDTDPRWWFTHVHFQNAQSPSHPGRRMLDPIHREKQTLIGPWLRELAPGRRTLDTFCANGAFAFEATRVGAGDVLGMDFDPPRIECARLIATLLERHGWRKVPRFESADVYRLDERSWESFDLTLCLGGLYHVADPVLVLRRMRKATREGGYLVLQTSAVIPLPLGLATFRIRREDRTQDGFSSLRAGQGVWKFTSRLVDRMLESTGFEVIERRSPSLLKRRRFPWYCVLARAA